jgi:hypothetical protein
MLKTQVLLKGIALGFLSNWKYHRQVWKLLPEYPVYSPPFHSSEEVLSKREIEANYDYFLEQKSFRLRSLTEFLASFSVELVLSETALPSLDDWIFRYGGHLLPDGGEVTTAVNDYEPVWTSHFRGLNVIHDVSIFAGDYIVSKNPNVRRDVYYGDGTHRDYDEQGFGQPCLFGLSHDHRPFGGQGFWPIFQDVFRWFEVRRYRIIHRGHGPPFEIDTPGSFENHLNHLGNPNPPPVVPISHLAMDD